jgi:ribose 5-phosphate isomerase
LVKTHSFKAIRDGNGFKSELIKIDGVLSQGIISDRCEKLVYELLQTE